jgi:protein-L-isoaspartate(D-aspartate) O-methyltransferase
MVHDQLEQRGITDNRVLAAMECVPREEFVPGPWRDNAYADCALPIACDQTISQPYTVAYMCQLAAIKAEDHVLEIGTGSGYCAAVLSLLAARVDTIEYIPALAETAEAVLSRLGYHNVSVHVGDGTLGLPEVAPFDVILVTAGAMMLPPTYQQQLAEGGRIVIPEGASRSHQTMARYTRHGVELQHENLGQFAFVPLVGKHGWTK